MFGCKERLKNHKRQLCCVNSQISFRKEHNKHMPDIAIEAVDIYNKIQSNREKVEKQIVKNGGIFGELCYISGFENERKDLNKIYKSNICCMIYDLNDIKLVTTKNGKTKLDITASLTGEKSRHLKLLMREDVGRFDFAPRLIISDDGNDFDFVTFDIMIILDNVCHECFYENIRTYDKFETFIKQYKS